MKRVKTEKINKLCPHCKRELRIGGIGSEQTGTKIETLSVEDGELLYEDYGFETSGSFETNGSNNFYCQTCGKNLILSEKEIIKILE